MNELELTNILRAMYENAPKGEKVAQIHLFGIKYVNELENANKTKIAENATGRNYYRTEINKSMKLAKYVELNSAGKEYVKNIILAINR